MGTVVVYGIVLYRARGRWQRRHDPRARRDLLGAIALFLCALASFGAITAVLFGAPGSGVRGFFVATALGAFFAAGLVMALVPAEER